MQMHGLRKGSAGSCLATLEGRSEQPNPLDLTAVIDLVLCESQRGANRSTQNTLVRQNQSRTPQRMSGTWKDPQQYMGRPQLPNPTGLAATIDLLLYQSKNVAATRTTQLTRVASVAL